MDINLFNKYEKLPKKTRRTERGDLLDYFLSRLNPPRIKEGFKPLDHKRLSFLLTGIPTKDLYALKSKCADGESRGVAYGAIFWTEIKPKDNPTESRNA